jgi:hypothetical protein
MMRLVVTRKNATDAINLESPPNNRHPVDFSLPPSWANGRCATAAPWLRQSGGDNHDEVAMLAGLLALIV